MSSGFVKVTGGGSAVTLDEFKEFAVITHDEDNRAIENILLPAATEHLERFTQRALVSQTLDYYCDNLSRRMTIPRSKASSITHVKYYDEDNVEQTIASSNYNMSVGREPSIIQFDEDFTLPVTRKRVDGVNIRFVAGKAIEEVESQYKLGVLMLAAHAYEHKGLVAFGASIAAIPRTLELFLETLRIKTLGRM